MPAKQTLRQVRYLLSSGSPLSAEQRRKEREELHTGAIQIKKSKDKKK